MSKTCGIYRIVHTESNRTYIGSSKNIEVRLRRHRYDLNRGKHFNAYLKRSWNKYNPEAFVFEPLVKGHKVSLETRNKIRIALQAYRNNGNEKHG